jgi:hypothetical protein
MSKKIAGILLLCSLVLSLFTACGETSKPASASAEPDQSGVSRTAINHVSNSSQTTSITLNGDSITVDGDGAVAEGSRVTIVAAGTYNISGNLTDGQIVVNTDDSDPVELILNGIDINNSTGTPIYVENAEQAVLVLADGTQNYVSDGASYVFENAEEDEPNAAIFSKGDLSIEGNGTLTVTGSYNDAIASKDGLTINGGVLVVNAVDDGIRGKDYVVVYDGQIVVNAQGDGLKSDNEEDTTLGYIAIENGVISVTAQGDAMQAQTNVTITGGDFTLVSGGGSAVQIGGTTSAKGIKAAVSVAINGGTFTIDSADDAIHSNDSIVINAGFFSIASGDDGMHADATLDVNGGDILITESYEGLESAVITINSGNLNITSSDDGLNVAGGNDGSGTMPGGGGGPGMMPGGGGAPDQSGQRPAPGGDFPPQDAFATSGGYYLYINGGYIVVNCGGDGLDSNGSAEITGGVVIVNGPTNDGNGAIDVVGSFDITGGMLVAVGSAGMAEAPDETSTQYSMLLNFDSMLPAGTLIHIQSSDGSPIVTFAAAKQFQSVVVSSPDFAAGETYEVYYGGSASGVMEDGLYQNATYSGGTPYTSFTTSSVVTRLGAIGSFGGSGRPG